MRKPYDIQKVLKKEQKALLGANDELNLQRHLYEEEKNDLKNFINGETEDIVWLDVSGTPMATKRSTLGLCKDSALAKQFDYPLWRQQDKATSTKKWSCEEVAGWVTTIEGMPENVRPTIVGNNINGAALLVMHWEDFKDIGVTQVWKLALLFKEITRLRTESTSVNHSAYCFRKILDILLLLAMRQKEGTQPTSVNIQEVYKKRFETILYYYFPGKYEYFILQARKIE